MPGEKPPFEDLYREFLSRIYGYVRAQLGSAADAEDVTAQVFMKAYEAYGRYEPIGGTPAPWLFRIARNATLDHYRRSGRTQKLERAVAAQPEVEVDPSQVAEERLQYAELLKAVGALPERHREVISLRHSGLSFDEVGVLMECSEDAAKMLYHRAIRSLRGRVARAEERAADGRRDAALDQGREG